MSSPTRTPRSSWIQEGLRALAAGGPDAVRIELLARALGVTRGGFYWHFDDRRGLLEEILDTWERVSVDEVIERVEREGGDARARLRRLSATGPGASRRSPSASDASTTGEWITCARCSAPSAPTGTTSRPAACSSTRCGLAATSWPPTTARATARR